MQDDHATVRLTSIDHSQRGSLSPIAHSEFHFFVCVHSILQKMTCGKLHKLVYPELMAV